MTKMKQTAKKTTEFHNVQVGNIIDTGRLKGLVTNVQRDGRYMLIDIENNGGTIPCFFVHFHKCTVLNVTNKQTTFNS